jgi:hypothetical protein
VVSIGLLLLLRNGDGDLVEDGKADHHAKGVRLRKREKTGVTKICILLSLKKRVVRYR